MKIIKGASVSLVIPKNATKREVFASSELKKYLTKIFDCEIEIKNDSESVKGDKIIIGSPLRNELAKNYLTESEFLSSVTKQEGFLIKGFDDALVIAGAEGDFERGTVYGVYEFLERFLNCSFSVFFNDEVEGGEYVPTLDSVDFNGAYYVKDGADSPYRIAIVQYGDAAESAKKGLNIAFFDWLVKNRYSHIQTWIEVYEGLKEIGLIEELDKRGIGVIPGHHGASRFFMPQNGNKYFPEKYYETHPEYYKLLSDGTRFVNKDHWGQNIFCSRNENLIKELTKNVIEWLKINPNVSAIYFIPQDGMADDCKCENCSKYSKTENFMFLMNEFANGIAAKFPNVKIVTLLYCDIWEYPKGLELNENLIIQEAVWNAKGLRYVGDSNGNGLNDTKDFEGVLLEWKNAGASVIYYDYFMAVYPARNRLVPMADTIQSIAKNFIKKGIAGSGTQIECVNFWNNVFNFYSFSRTLYDNSLSIEDNLERFTKIFGEGAKKISEIIKLCEEVLGGEITLDEGGWELMQRVDKDRVYKLFDEALSSAKGALFRNNIRMFRMAFRYSDLEVQQDNAKAQYPYERVKYYKNVNPELLYMTRFDSYSYSEKGYGIMIPVRGEVENEFTPNEWYKFD